jgi:hypothetical protein
MPGPVLAELAWDGDRSVLDIWTELFDQEVDAVFWSDDLARATVPLLVKTYVEPVVPIGELVTDAAAAQFGPAPAPSPLGAPVRMLLDLLTQLGATTSESDAVRVTALGQFRLSDWFGSVGIDAPAVTDLADADPIDIMDLAITEDEAGRESLISEWIKARGRSARRTNWSSWPRLATRLTGTPPSASWNGSVTVRRRLYVVVWTIRWCTRTRPPGSGRTGWPGRIRPRPILTG